MTQKLRCVAVDDDTFSNKIVIDIFKHSAYAEITNSFTSPKKFLEALPTLDFDMCLLGIDMSEMGGLLVATKLNGKPVIFVTAKDEMLRGALDMSPIDVITKPVLKPRLENTLHKAHKILSTPREGKKANEYQFFSVEGESGKVKLKLSDIFFIQSDIEHPRNKHLYLRNGNIHMIKDCKFEDFMERCPALIRINRSEMVSLEIVQKYSHDTITLEGFTINGKVKHLSLSRMYRIEFSKRMSAL